MEFLYKLYLWLRKQISAVGYVLLWDVPITQPMDIKSTWSFKAGMERKGNKVTAFGGGLLWKKEENVWLLHASTGLNMLGRPW